MDDIVDRGYLRSRRKSEKTSGGGHGEGASVLLPEALEGERDGMILDYLVLPLWTVLGTRYSMLLCIHPRPVHRDFLNISIQPEKDFLSIYTAISS